MRTEAYSSESRRLVPIPVLPADRYLNDTAEQENHFTRAAASKLTARRLFARIDWAAVGAGAFVYAVAFAAWSWLVR